MYMTRAAARVESLVSLKTRVYIGSTQMGSTLNCLNGLKVFSN